MHFYRQELSERVQTHLHSVASHSDGPMWRRHIAKDANVIGRALARHEYISAYVIVFYKFQTGTGVGAQTSHAAR
jgi:hypothetical protein